MSALPGLALLVVMTQAFRARFGDDVRVHMQPDAPVVVDEGKSVCLFIERTTAHPEGPSLTLGDGQVVLRVELYSPALTPALNSIPLARLQGHAALPFMWRECIAALDPSAAPWGALWEKFRLALDAEMSAPPLLETQKGVKVAAWVFSITVDSLGEPLFGEPRGAWAALLASLRAAGGELPEFADLLEASLRGGDMPAWRALGMSLGVSRDTLNDLGIGPDAPSPPDETPADIEAGADDLPEA